MQLAEGSIVVVNLICGCTEKRVQVMEGSQAIHCPECGKGTRIELSRQADGSFRLMTNWA